MPTFQDIERQLIDEASAHINFETNFYTTSNILFNLLLDNATSE